MLLEILETGDSPVPSNINREGTHFFIGIDTCNFENGMGCALGAASKFDPNLTLVFFNEDASKVFEIPAGLYCTADQATCTAYGFTQELEGMGIFHEPR